MNKIKNSSMFLLWAGAAISLSEIYTGGIIAPLGLRTGILAIIIGHIIGTLFLSFGGYISFKDSKNAMESVRSRFGKGGARIIAALNVLQLIGWSAIMIIQGGRALSSVFKGLSINMSIFIMAVLVFLWVYYFNNYSKLINDISVIALFILCVTLFFGAHNRISVPLHENISFITAMELSIAMPVSWLPLVGDYAKDAKTKSGSFFFIFWGYFAGSVLMYSLGLFITISTGKDIIEFIAMNNFKVIACIIVVLSTTTTTFLDIYSAVISSKQIINIKKENNYIIIYSIISAVIAYIFPIEQYQNFLLTVGSVFIPVYTVVFLEYLFNRQAIVEKMNIQGLALAVIGTIVYYWLTKIQFGTPTLLVIGVIIILYFMFKKILSLGVVKNDYKSI